MSDAVPNAKTMIAAAFAALNSGDTQKARDSFTRALATEQNDANAWYGLAQVYRRLGAPAEEDAALDRALAINPQHLPALIAKGDRYVRAGDLPAASSYYSAVLKLAQRQPSLAPELRAELKRIELECQRFTREYEAHLLAAVAATGVNATTARRFNHAVDLLLGKRQAYFQEPKNFFFPELPHVQFYDPREFSWVEALQNGTADIRRELLPLVASGTGFEPYIQRTADRPAFNPRGLLNNSDWSAYYLIKNGVEVAEQAARCPRTMTLLREVPLCRINGRTPSVLFSLLRPGARIRPHHGFTNVRLICHLPLIVPGQCALRVGNETREWREGELFMFDDTIEHEAWNSSAELRVVLLFDIWRPELSREERVLVAAMLEAVSRFGPRREWTE
jgi:aspartate beta-hydroxylase